MINVILGIIFFLIAISIIVVVHEWGHLIVAKRNGVKCFEFSIGMGPKLFTFHIDKEGTVYNVRAIPLGGYVMMAGEQEAEDQSFEADQSLANKHPWQKIKILFAGAIMNFILGWFLLFIIYFLGGISVPTNSNIINVTPDSPANIAGLESGDQIIAIDQIQTDTYEQIVEQLENKDNVDITYISDNSEKQAVINKEQINCTTSIIGISPETENVKFKFLASFKSANNLFLKITLGIGESLKLLINGTAGVSDLMGPIGLANASKSVVSMGFQVMIFTIAFLSINIGFVNILPFPALDGGRIILAFIELITKRKVPQKIEMYLNLIGFLLLMALFVVVTFADVERIGSSSPYTVNVNSDTVCARDVDEINYTFNFDEITSELPSEVNIELKVSEGKISKVQDNYNQIDNDSDEIVIKYTDEDVSTLPENEITVSVMPDNSSNTDLDLTIEIYDEKNNIIKQAIYRIDK